MARAPRAPAASAALPRRSSDGSPRDPRRTSISRQSPPVPHPSPTALKNASLAANRAARVRDWVKFRRDAIEEGRTRAMKRVVFVPGDDPARAAALAATLYAYVVPTRASALPLGSAVALIGADRVEVQSDYDKLRRIPYLYSFNVLNTLALLCTVSTPLALLRPLSVRDVQEGEIHTLCDRDPRGNARIHPA
mgnify:CR=1 FL=1